MAWVTQGRHLPCQNVPLDLHGKIMKLVFQMILWLWAVSLLCLFFSSPFPCFRNPWASHLTNFPVVGGTMWKA